MAGDTRADFILKALCFLRQHGQRVRSVSAGEMVARPTPPPSPPAGPPPSGDIVIIGVPEGRLNVIIVAPPDSSGDSAATRLISLTAREIFVASPPDRAHGKHLLLPCN